MPETWLAIFEVVVGLGLVIFVHELGHFVVAKLCGVKCEKFYLGFDIGGLKLCKFRCGETEYGIGILPLGGYVKMLGQEDNPARLREEIERAKQPAGRADAGRVGRAERRRGGGRPAGAVRSPQLPGQERAAADGDHLGRRGHEPDLRLADGGGRHPLLRRAGSSLARVGYIVPGEGAWQADLRAGRRDPRSRRPAASPPSRTCWRPSPWATCSTASRWWCGGPARKNRLHIEVKATQAGGQPRIGVGSPLDHDALARRRLATARRHPGRRSRAALPARRQDRQARQPAGAQLRGIHAYLARTRTSRCGSPSSGSCRREGPPPAAARSKQLIRPRRPQSHALARAGHGDGADHRRPGRFAGRRGGHRAGRHDPHRRRPARGRSHDPAANCSAAARARP